MDPLPHRVPGPETRVGIVEGGFVKYRIGFLVLAGLVAMGCRRHEEKPVSAMEAMPAGHGGMAPRKASVVQVPDAIKGRWKAGRFALVEIATKKVTPFVAVVGRDTPVPGTNLSIQVEALLPDFVMGDGVITSKSDKLANPAAKARISEGGVERFNGWLFSMFPETHPFEHPKYQVRLLEFVPAEAGH